jgi:hypothetical protein
MSFKSLSLPNFTAALALFVAGLPTAGHAEATSVIKASECSVGVYPLRVTFKTADVSGAGTDSNIDFQVYSRTTEFPAFEQAAFVEIVRTSSSTGEFRDVPWRINPLLSGNAFERDAQETVVSCVTPDQNKVMENPDRIVIDSDGLYAGAGWRLEWVRIHWHSPDPKTGDRIHQCDVDQWIDGDVDWTAGATCKLRRILAPREG